MEELYVAAAHLSHNFYNSLAAFVLLRFVFYFNINKIHIHTYKHPPYYDHFKLMCLEVEKVEVLYLEKR